MKYKNIGLTDLKASVLSLGCLHFSVYLDQKQSNQLIHYCIDNGINFFDTGPLYGNGNSEKILGEIIKDKRKDLLISTKAGLEKEIRPDGSFGVKVKKLTPKYIKSSLEKSLKEMKTDYIDLFQLHAFDNSTPLSDTIGELEILCEKGMIRSFGVSNFDPKQLNQVNKILSKSIFKGLAAIECHYNIIERKMESGVIPECKKYGVSLMPYRALARGILSGQYNIDGTIPVGSRAEDSWRVRDWLNPETLSLVNRLRQLAESYGISVAQLSLSWLLCKPVVCSAIIGVKSISHIEELLSASIFDFTEEIYNKVDQIIKSEGEYDNIKNRPNVYFEK